METQKFGESGFAEKAKTSIAEREQSIAYLGVELPKGGGGEFCPKKENYKQYKNQKFYLQLQQKIATSWKMDEPMLIEGGTSIGKTTTVRKMCADLGYEVYYTNLNGATDVEDLMGRYVPNADRKNSNEPEYKWTDGPVTAGLRQAGEKIRVIILDEYNSANPNIIIRLHEVLDELEKNGEVVLAEDASERVKVNKTKTKIIALTNPPGKGYLDRQPLDPAQLRRWNYQKEATELSKDTFSGSVDMLFGLKPEIEEMPDEEFLFSNDAEIPIEELKEIPGMKELVEKYKEFHQASKELLKNRKIAQDQPQAFTYDDRMEPQRVLKFIQHFYRGDINVVWKKALRYFYVNKLENETDKQKLLEIIDAIEYVAPVESRRKGFEREIPQAISEPVEKREGLSGTLAEQIKNAKEILGEEFFIGPEDVEETFGFKLNFKDIPQIPFSVEEIELHQKRGDMLVLNLDKTPDGELLTIEMMSTKAINVLGGNIIERDAKGDPNKYLLYTNQFDENGKVKSSAWFSGEAEISKQTPKAGWQFVSPEILPPSISKDAISQIEVLMENAKSDFFSGKFPVEHAEAEKEFQSKKDEIRRLMSENKYVESSKLISELKISQLLSEPVQNAIFRYLVSYKKGKQLFVDGKYMRSMCGASSDGGLLLFGDADSSGALVNGDDPDSSYVSLGAVSSRF